MHFRDMYGCMHRCFHGYSDPQIPALTRITQPHQILAIAGAMAVDVSGAPLAQRPIRTTHIGGKDIYGDISERNSHHHSCESAVEAVAGAQQRLLSVR